MTVNLVHACRIGLAAATIAVALGLAATGVVAQSGKQSPGLFKANPQKRDQPVKITSASLEVRDKEKKAMFSGDVHVIQGDMDVRCSVLVVFYDDDSDKSGAAKAPPGRAGPKSATGGGNQQIRRMEARGSVILTQKDQKAVAERADFDVRANTLTMIGGVVVTRGEDVLRGQRLFVDLTSGVSRMESGGGRVEGMFKSKGQSPELQPPGRGN